MGKSDLSGYWVHRDNSQHIIRVFRDPSVDQWRYSMDWVVWIGSMPFTISIQTMYERAPKALVILRKAQGVLR